MTSDLLRRMYEHKNKLIDGFTTRYCIDRLLYYEIAENPTAAIEREKQIKKYSQKKKLDLIISQNQNLNDISDKLTEY